MVDIQLTAKVCKQPTTISHPGAFSMAKIEPSIDLSDVFGLTPADRKAGSANRLLMRGLMLQTDLAIFLGRTPGGPPNPRSNAPHAVSTSDGEVLDVVGGFDETFGFSRVGVEDFSRRVRSANFLVACCEDAYAHLFPAAEAESLVGNLDAGLPRCADSP